MCDYCELFPGCEIGKPYQIETCANGDLKVRATYMNGGIILFKECNIASGYIEIHFCPICGRKLPEESKET